MKRESDNWGTTPGLPDEAFETDGLLTKRHLRASALAHLRPQPGQLLWDLGTGSGSIAIEWCRTHPECRANAVERREVRAERARSNFDRLTSPGQVRLQVAEAAAAVASWSQEASPDAIFIGGGCTPKIIDACHAALGVGGRLVVHGVTIETEAEILAAAARFGGEVTRIGVEKLEPLASWHVWKAAYPVVAWNLVK